MTALEATGFDAQFAHPTGCDPVAVGGTWELCADYSGSGVELVTRRRGLRPPFARPLVQRLPLLAGAVSVYDPLDCTVGEITVGLSGTGTARLTICDVTALGNRRYAVDLVFSHCGPAAGPDELLQMEGGVVRGRDETLRAELSGPAPRTLGGENVRLRLSAAFIR